MAYENSGVTGQDIPAVPRSSPKPAASHPGSFEISENCFQDANLRLKSPKSSINQNNRAFNISHGFARGVGMDKESVTLTYNSGDTSLELPVLEGSVGPKAFDVTRVYKKTGMFTFDPGFMATASCRSAITYIDGEKGILRYRGYPIEQLAEQSSFLEVAYLLLYGELPSAEQLLTLLSLPPTRPPMHAL